MSMMQLTINYAVIRRNIVRIKTALAEQTGGKHISFFACLKANAYGFGTLEVAETIKDLVDGFQLGSLEEAKRIKNIIPRHKILLFAAITPPEILEAVELGFTVTVFNQQSLDLVLELGQTKSLNVAVKVNSGLERLGVLPSELSAIVKALVNKGHNLRGVYTHLPFQGAEAEPWARGCMSIFEKTVTQMRENGQIPKSAFIQARASSWIASGLGANDNAVSIGHLLFGFKNSAQSVWVDSLESPLVSLKTKIIQVREVASDSRYYKGSYFSKGVPTKVGIAAGGLVNGLTVSGANGLTVSLNETPRTVIGVSLENFILDVSAEPLVNVGDEVIVASGEDVGDGSSLRKLAHKQGMTEVQLMFLFSKLNSTIQIGHN